MNGSISLWLEYKWMSPTLIWGQPILSHSLSRHPKCNWKCNWLTQSVWRPPAPLEVQLETPGWYRKLPSWSLRVTVSRSTVKLHLLEEDVHFVSSLKIFILSINLGFNPDLNPYSWENLPNISDIRFLCLPALRCPTTSARLPFLTLVMKAPNLPDSVILPPTT